MDFEGQSFRAKLTLCRYVLREWGMSGEGGGGKVYARSLLFKFMRAAYSLCVYGVMDFIVPALRADVTYTLYRCETFHSKRTLPSVYFFANYRELWPRREGYIRRVHFVPGNFGKAARNHLTQFQNILYRGSKFNLSN